MVYSNFGGGRSYFTSRFFGIGKPFQNIPQRLSCDKLGAEKNEGAWKTDNNPKVKINEVSSI